MSAKCPHEDGWGYLFEIEDVDGVSDLPNSNNEIANGFQYENSYYVGNEALDTMIPDTGGTASICSGTTHDTDGTRCPGAPWSASTSTTSHIGVMGARADADSWSREEPATRGVRIKASPRLCAREQSQPP